MKRVTRIVVPSTTETPPRLSLVIRKWRPSGASRTSRGSPPTRTDPVTFIEVVSTRATMPLYSQLTSRYRPFADMSRSSAPIHGMLTQPSFFQVRRSKKYRPLSLTLAGLM